jgi:hypothetical protein
MSARDVIAKALIYRLHLPNRLPMADRALSALTAAGYRIVPPGGLDAETVERCIAEINCGCEPDHCPSPGFCAKNDVAALRALDAIAQRNGGKT